MYQKSVLEEHIILIKEPASLFIWHVTPDSSSTRNIVKSIVEEKKELTQKTLL